MTTVNQLNPDLWVKHYADYLLNYTLTKVNDIELAKDLVQDTFIAALHSAKNFKGESTEKTWLISILKRKIIDYYRSKNSKKGQSEVRINSLYADQDEGDWLEEQVSNLNALGADEQLENIELGLAINLCIHQLPPNHADVFKMKTIQGMDTEDICNELQIKASNLWVMLHRARTALMNCLNQTWFQ